jgi:hypothetical protein
MQSRASYDRNDVLAAACLCRDMLDLLAKRSQRPACDNPPGVAGAVEFA